MAVARADTLPLRPSFTLPLTPARPARAPPRALPFLLPRPPSPTCSSTPSPRKGDRLERSLLWTPGLSHWLSSPSPEGPRRPAPRTRPVLHARRPNPLAPAHPVDITNFSTRLRDFGNNSSYNYGRSRSRRRTSPRRRRRRRRLRGSRAAAPATTRLGRYPHAPGRDPAPL